MQPKQQLKKSTSSLWTLRFVQQTIAALCLFVFAGVTLAATAPSAPRTPTAVGGNKKATVAFVAPTSDGGSPITGYTVTSSPAGGVDSNAGTTGLSHVVTGLTNGTAYRFTVKATNAIGTSVASANSNRVTPATTAPSAPTGAAAVGGNAQATVTFVAPADNGGSTITGYTVTSLPAGGVDSNAGTTGLNHVITGLTNGTAYTFTVKATNAKGTSAASTPSNSVTPTAVLSAPGAPRTATATGGNTQATVSFVAPLSNGGSAITGYTVTSLPAGGVDSNAGTTGLNHVITGLANGTAYTFTVTATNAIGTGVASTSSNSVTPATVPDAPTSAAAVGGNAQATVTFVAPVSDGGAAITGYTVTSLPAGGVDSNAGTTGLSHVITGLTNGTAYTFTVKAINAKGTSAASSASNSVTPVAVVPDAPNIGTATAGDKQSTVSFTAPVSNGGSAITGYTVTSSPTGGVDSNAGTTGLNHVITGLTNGNAYTFTVTATNAIGTSPASTASNSVTPATVPDAPTSASAIGGFTQATVSFIAPVSDGGSAISGYIVTSSPAGGVDSNAGTTGLSHVITGLTNGTVYTFTVTANNAKGTSSASAASNSVTPGVTVPDAPATPGVAVSPYALGQVNVYFNAPVSNGGSAITGYTVTSSPAGGVDSNGGSTSLSHNITGLTIGTVYTFTVTATNASGTSAASAPSNSVTMPIALRPNPPTGITAVGGNAQANVTFVAPVSDGGSPITGYTVTSSPAGGVDVNTGTPGLSHVITGLTNGTNYTFNVTATNAFGTSSLGNWSNTVTPSVGNSSVTTLESSLNPMRGDETTLLAIKVTGVTPTGFVRLYDVRYPGSNITSYPLQIPLTDGKVMIDWQYPAGILGNIPGVLNLKAEYLGDANNAPSSAVLALTVLKSNSSTTLTSGSNLSLLGQPVQLTARLGPTNTSPRGTVTFKDGATVLGTSVISYSNGSWRATFNATFSTLGTHDLTAVYSGDVNNNPSTSAVLSQPVVAAINVPDAPTNVVAVTGECCNGSGQYGYAVVAFKAPAVNGNDGNTAITGYTVTSIPAGGVDSNAGSTGLSHTITGLTFGTPYTFTVKTNNSAGSSVASVASNSVTPQYRSVVTTLTSSLNPAQPGQNFNLTVSTDRQVAGSAYIYDNGALLTTVSLYYVSTATIPVSFGVEGVHNLTAYFAGDTNNDPSTSFVLAQSITKPTLTPTITLTSGLNPSGQGQSVFLTALLTGAGSTQPGTATYGTVTFMDGATVLGTSSVIGVVGSESKATFYANFNTSGTHNLTVVYSGDAQHLPVTSAVLAQTVNISNATITTLTSSLSSAPAGQVVTLTAAVAGVTPTGTITFKDGGVTVGTGTLTDGIATLNTSFVAVGNHSLTAVYSGDTNNASSTSVITTQSITIGSSTTILNVSANPARIAQTITLTATFTGALPSGTVTFKDGTTTIGTSTIAAGQATLNLSYAAVSSHSLTAVYAGDSNNTGSTSEVVSLNVIENLVTYFHNDISATPLAETDATGALIWKQSYRPYGDPVQPPDSDNKILYTGKPYDKEMGLTYMGARYYDPLIGRFMGVDPVGFTADNVHSFNRYAYANNNPYKFVDPDGCEAIEVRSAAWMRTFIPGQVAWDNARTAIANGSYDSAAVAVGMMGAEVSLSVMSGGTTRLIAGQGGQFSKLVGTIGDDLTAHHIPQAALKFTSRAEGGAVVMTTAEHEATRTYAGKGARTAIEDAGMSFRDVLAKDMRDVRSIVGNAYNKGLQDVSKYYKENFPDLMKK